MPRKKEKEPPRKRKPSYYWWLLGNVVAACAAVLSWVLCLNIFQHPEVPRNYEILRKLGQAGVPLPLQATEAPPGEAADPRALYRRYAALPKDSLDQLNAALMRNYLSQLKERKLIQYIQGVYQVEEVRRLGEDDLFSQGFVVRARAMLPPDEFSKPAPWPVVIEYLFPTPTQHGMAEIRRKELEEAYHEKNPDGPPLEIPESELTFTKEEIETYTANAMALISPGDQLSVQKFPNCAMVLHVSKLEGEDTPLLCLTVTPAAFGEYSVGEENRFKLAAPEALNPAAPMPVFQTPPAKPNP